MVKEEEEEFNLLKTLANLSEYLGQQAAGRVAQEICNEDAAEARRIGIFYVL